MTASNAAALEWNVTTAKRIFNGFIINSAKHGAGTLSHYHPSRHSSALEIVKKYRSRLPDHVQQAILAEYRSSRSVVSAARASGSNRWTVRDFLRGIGEYVDQKTEKKRPVSSKKEAFLTALAEGKPISAAIAAAKCGCSSAYRWLPEHQGVIAKAVRQQRSQSGGTPREVKDKLLETARELHSLGEACRQHGRPRRQPYKWARDAGIKPGDLLREKRRKVADEIVAYMCEHDCFMTVAARALDHNEIVAARTVREFYGSVRSVRIAKEIS